MKKVLIFLAVFIISKTIFPQIIFGEQQLITHPADDARSVFAIDLDGDGDNDVLSASHNDDKIAWYKNDGNGNFGVQQVITTNADGAQSVYAIVSNKSMNHTINYIRQQSITIINKLMKSLKPKYQ